MRRISVARHWRKNLEVSTATALMGLAGIVATAIFFPCVFALMIAFACGWGVGLFHGVKSEIDRKFNEPQNPDSF